VRVGLGADRLAVEARGLARVAFSSTSHATHLTAHRAKQGTYLLNCAQ
jgi:hypothetical protein